MTKTNRMWYAILNYKIGDDCDKHDKTNGLLILCICNSLFILPFEVAIISCHEVTHIHGIEATKWLNAWTIIVI